MEIFISINGNDLSEGSISAPIKSIYEAIKRAKVSKDTVTVYLMPGIYRIANSVVLEKMNNISFKADKGGEVVISGAREVFLKGLDEQDEKFFNNNPNKAKIKMADLSEKISQNPYGYYKMSIDVGFPMILKDKKPIELSKFPKTGFFEAEGADGKTFSCDAAKGFSFDELWYYGYPKYEWADYMCQLEKKGSVFELKRDIHDPICNGTNYCFMNTADNMAENEWTISFKRSKIYFCGDAEKLEFPYLKEALVRTVDCENILFEGITFEMTRGNGVENLGGRNVSYKNCEFQYISKSAAVFGYNETKKNCYGYMGDGGIDCGIENCKIYYVGMGGVYLSGGNRDTLTPCHNYVKECHIENFSILSRTYRPGVRLSGVGCLVQGNKIHCTTHIGVNFEGNEHIIEGNEIYDVLQFSDDAGAIYSGRDWAACGTVIRNNYFHHIKPGRGTHGTYAIYIDDCSGTSEICGNYFEEIPCAVYVHGGRNMNVHDNIIKDSDKAFLFNHNHPDLVECNKVILMDRIKNVDITNKAWDKYLIIRNILEDEPMEPKYNRIYNNLLINTPFGKIAEEVEKTGEIDRGCEIKKS